MQVLASNFRTASLVSTTKSVILTLGKEPFLKTMGELIKKTNLSLIEKLKNLTIFKNWSLAQLASLYKHFEKKSYSLNSILYKAGEKHDFLYVVVKGEVQVQFR